MHLNSQNSKKNKKKLMYKESWIL